MDSDSVNSYHRHFYSKDMSDHDKMEVLSVQTFWAVRIFSVRNLCVSFPWTVMRRICFAAMETMCYFGDEMMGRMFPSLLLLESRVGLKIKLKFLS